VAPRARRLMPEAPGPVKEKNWGASHIFSDPTLHL